MTALALDPAAVPLEAAPLDPAQVLAGDPQVAYAELDRAEVGGVVVERGVWQHTPGVSTDVEADELFVVLSGRATVEVEGGPTFELVPGTLGLLRAGDRTVWRVHETLRKVYQATVPA
nr:cupin domain-containing protein [Patulibacter sp. SYSU D01012]